MAAGGTVDPKREIDAYRATRGRFDVLRVPAMDFLMVDGEGDPNTAPAYADAVGALFPLAYGLKAVGRDEVRRDTVVMPLEGLWWADDPDAFTTRRDASRWRWTLMVMVPGWVTAAHLDAARARVAGRRAPPRLDEVRLERFDEGLAVQTLHVGPYDAEGPVVAAMHDEVRARGRALTGRHHEVYLGDARRTAPERLRTILRQPVREGTPSGATRQARTVRT